MKFYDELEGGAISSAKQLESAYPTTPDYTTVMPAATISQGEGARSSFYSEALNMIPKNMYPMWQYSSLLEASRPEFVKNTLLKGLSGRGAKHDDHHIRKATVHSLKKYPQLLRAYLNSTV